MRRFLASVLLVGILAAIPSAAPAATDCTATVAGVDLQSATIPQLQDAMAAGKLTSAQLVKAYLARIAAYDGKLNAIRALAPDALAQARALAAERAAGHVRGPLHGIPILLKDNYDTADMPTTAGSIALEGVVPKDEATATRRLRDGGSIILGKTELSEFAGWVSLRNPPGYSSLGGQVVNANDFDFSPSGSSAGSGVAASMAFATGTLGTETSGSILSPADANGDVGVKTTRGLASRFGILPLSPSYDVPGPIARDVTDAAILVGAIAGPDPHDPVTADAASHEPPGGDYTPSLRADALHGVTLTYSNDDYNGLDDEHKALFDDAIARIQKVGGMVVPSRTLGSTESFGLAEIGAIPNEFKQSFNQYLADEMPNAKVHSLSDVIAFNSQHPDKFPHGQELLQGSDATPGSADLFAAQDAPAQTSAQQSIDSALAETGAQAILTPGNLQANIGAAAGYPTVMVPNGYTNGGKDPSGVGFLGQAYTEPKLLGYAYAYEQASHARVAPTDVNPGLAPASCPAAPAHAPTPQTGVTFRVLKPLALSVGRRGHRVTAHVRHAYGARVTLVIRRGGRVVARRAARIHNGAARIHLRLRRAGRYSVTVVDPGPPPRTALLRLRVVSSR